MGKLVRNLVPANVRAAGGEISTRRLDDHDFARELRAKLIEEAGEVAAAADRDSLLDELADVTEVLHELARFEGIELNELSRRVTHKAGTHGGFGDRLFSTTYRPQSLGAHDAS